MKSDARLILILTILSIIVGGVFTGRGLFMLGASNAKPVDLALRWREVVYVQQGVNPYDISDYLYRVEKKLPLPEQAPAIDPQLGGTSIASGYPPWAFLWASAFIPPLQWEVARLWFLAINFAALGFLGVFAWRSPGVSSRQHRVFLTSCILSANAIGTTLGNGQWGIILCSLLALTSLQLQKGAVIAPALAYAAALLKPTFGFTHAAIFLRRWSWGALLLAGTLTALAWLLVTWHVGTNPIDMLRQMLDQTARWKDISYSLPDALVSIGTPRSLAMLGCLAAGVSIAVYILRERPGDSLFELAVCGTLARVFAYHQLYDNVLIVFLVLAVARLAVTRGHRGDMAVLIVLLISIWIPGRFTSLLAVQISQIVLWCAALGWLVAKEPSRRTRHGDENDPMSVPKR